MVVIDTVPGDHREEGRVGGREGWRRGGGGGEEEPGRQGGE